MQKKATIENENIKLAMILGQELKKDILEKAKSEGFEAEEVLEDFSDIISDVAYRYPESLTNKTLFINNFIKEL